MNAKDEVLVLRKTLEEHSRSYYVLDAPTISDYEYDMLMQRLRVLEESNPELISPDSPTQRVGGEALKKFAQVEHEIALESLNDVFSLNELTAFGQRMDSSILEPHSYVAEPKIDGLSMSLEYQDGVFIRGATRGDGRIGEDVTHNLKTIRSLPLKLTKAPKKLIVRGEVYMSRDVFEELNAIREENDEQLLANPRNAAAGSVRQLDPKIAASRKLDIIVFNIQTAGDISFETHTETLEYLAELGFNVVPYTLCSTIDECCAHIDYMGEHRDEFAYDIDGAVVKINSLSQRTALGSTSKAPRWAAAYKYPPEERESRVVDIIVKVGRTGVLTPKAVVEPVRLAGTTVTNATLHNQDFIDKLDVRIGDTVVIRKAGEIIPEILSVNKNLRPDNTVVFRLPELCPECGSHVARDIDGAAVRCTSPECPAQLLRNIVQYASRGAMDIEGLGESIVESLVSAGLISSPAELYYLEPQSVAALDRLGKKSAENLINAIENSKSRGLAKLLFAFGIRQVGQKAGKVLASYFKNLDELMAATKEELTVIPDIGPVTAGFITEWFKNPQSQHQIYLLKNAGVSFESAETQIDSRFAGKTFVLTGTLEKFTRDEAAEIIESFGGKSSDSVSKKTAYVLAGKNAGSKLTKAESLGIEIITDEQFAEMIK